MKQPDRLPEQQGRENAYAGRMGVTYYRYTDTDLTNTWHYLKDVEKVEFRSTDGRVNDKEIDVNDVTSLRARAGQLQRVGG